ncbi:efflux transporter periplasmic adaptor subunit [Lysobacteraceae bacterium NML120232]|nr:efflux transporter periplasmic adaptor subunit [Xanthomonadaceae bacterium NML08-0793]PJK12528.1 efflux transporter periplasmic adaptor subunit [Xanthomonadaceae bacterium NML120232]
MPASCQPIFRSGAIALIAAFSLTLVACSPPQEADKKADEREEKVEAVVVETARVEPRTLSASHVGTAALEARAEAQAISRTSGVALQVLVEEGQQVRAGQALARLDADRARLQVAQTGAQVAKLEANYRRASQLAEQKMVSANDVDQLRFDLQNARAAHQMARLELSYTTVEAPISGVIASKSIKPGNFVQINSPVFRIVDTSRLEATLNVPEREIDRIKKGQPVVLRVDALPGRSFAGQVDRIAPVVDAGSGTFRVVAGFAGEGSLQSGMFGRLSIQYEQRAQVPAIPRSALLDESGDSSVYVVRDGKAERVAIETGHTEDGYLEVRKGLAVGEQVVIAGKNALREGSPVQVIDENAPAKAEKPAEPQSDSN